MSRALSRVGPVTPESPYCAHAEIAILGAMILDEVAVADATEKLIAADFYLDSHQRIFTAIMALVESEVPVDFITVQEALTRSKLLETIGGPAYLAYLTEGIPRNLHIAAYVRIVKEKAMLRTLIRVYGAGVARAYTQTEKPEQIVKSLFDELKIEMRRYLK